MRSTEHYLYIYIYHGDVGQLVRFKHFWCQLLRVGVGVSRACFPPPTPAGIAGVRSSTILYIYIEREIMINDLQ